MEPTFERISGSFKDIENEQPFQNEEWIERERCKLLTLASSAMSEPEGFKGALTAFLNCAFINGEHGPILDFGGGTGYLYFTLNRYLCNSEVEWHVVDNPQLAELGVAFAEENKQKNIRFFSELGATHGNNYGVVHSSTALQYIDDIFGVLRDLLALKARYFILTRTKISFNETFVTAQRIGGKITPCRFIQIEELRDFINDEGYQLAFHSTSLLASLVMLFSFSFQLSSLLYTL